MLAHKIPLPLPVDSRYVNRTFPLDVPDHLRYRILRRYGDHHVNVVGHQMPLLNPALFLFGELMKHLAKVNPQLAVQHLPAALRDKLRIPAKLNTLSEGS